MENSSPAKVIREIFLGNDNFVNCKGEDFFKEHIESQNPVVTLVTCSDARVQPQIFFQDMINKVFVIRNIGNQIENTKGSVDYGIFHLKTPVLFILGHVHCGAIGTFLKGYEKEAESIRNELDHLYIPLSKVNKSETFEKAWLNGVEINVNWQVQIAIDRYREYVEDGRLVVVGAVYDFANTYGKGYGRIVIININGETDAEKIRESEALSLIPEDLKEKIVV
ncbi:carbonic anhydrase [Desulfurobacterium crinifex]